MKCEGMKAYILDLGYLLDDKALVFPNCFRWTRTNNDPKVYPVKMPCYSVLVDHPTAGKFLYDLSFNPDWSNEDERCPQMWRDRCPCYRTEEQTMEAQLALCGTKPEEISNIILSHLHWDHTGYLPMFEHCEVYAPEKELANGLIKVHSQDMLEQYSYYKYDLFANVKRYIPVTDEEEDVEIFPGVHVINLPGHAPGILGLLLEMEGKNIFFPSDACYVEANLDVKSGNVYDSIKYGRSLKKIREYAKKYDAELLFDHDIDFFENKMKKAPLYYE